jgi:hypothetical protein
MFSTDRIIALENAGTSFRPRRAALLRTYLAELRERDADAPVQVVVPQ